MGSTNNVIKPFSTIFPIKKTNYPWCEGFQTLLKKKINIQESTKKENVYSTKERKE